MPPAPRAPARHAAQARAAEVSDAGEDGGGVVRGDARLAPRIEAFRAIVDPWRARGWGFRVALIGASGSGKSYFAKQLIDYALATGAATSAFVYDHKEPTPQAVYADHAIVRASAADLIARPPEPGDPAIIVFHDVGAGDPDEVAALGMALAPDEKIVVDIDETFPDAVTPAGREFKSGDGGSLGLLFRAGRSRGSSSIIGTQLPQKVPSVVSDLCESEVWFRVQRRSLGYVERQECLPPEAIPLLRNLKTREQSEFLLVVEGEWDGKIYGPR